MNDILLKLVVLSNVALVNFKRSKNGIKNVKQL